MGRICFLDTIKTEPHVRVSTAYAWIKEWFSSGESEFNRSNDGGGSIVRADIKKKALENAQEIEKAFHITDALISEDPESNRLTAKLVLRYTGTACIHLMYVEYNLILIVRPGQIEMEYALFNYADYNQKTFREQVIFNWKDGIPCDARNTLEYLMNCGSCKEEFTAFYQFLNRDIGIISNELQTFVAAKSKSKHAADGHGVGAKSAHKQAK